MTHQTLIELSQKDLDRITILDIGDVILEFAKYYKEKAIIEFLEPISVWIDDEDFAKIMSAETKSIDYAKYKRNQRLWTKIERILHSQKMKAINEEKRKQRNARIALGSLGGRGKNLQSEISKTDLISPIISLFGKPAMEQFDRNIEFQKLHDISPRLKLPYKELIINNLKNGITTFEDLPNYYYQDQTKDTVAKLQTLLELDSESFISIRQKEPFGTICIDTTSSLGFNSMPEGSFIITDQNGHQCEINPEETTDDQLSAVIRDLSNNKMMLRAQ